MAGPDVAAAYELGCLMYCDPSLCEKSRLREEDGQPQPDDPLAAAKRAAAAADVAVQGAGNALADVLFGDADPGGRLPTNFPRRFADNPTYPNYPRENGQLLYTISWNGT